jgi:hypothetical protein
MRVRMWVIIVGTAFVAPSPSAAQSPSSSTSLAAPLAAPSRLPSPGAKSYRELFEVPDLAAKSTKRARVLSVFSVRSVPLWPVRRPERSAELKPDATPPQVVCGMTIIPADPTVDPRIRLTPPPSNTRHTMRMVPPSICR